MQLENSSLGKKIINNMNRPKNWLLLGNILLVFFLILLNNLKIIPFRTPDFIFFALLFLALSLYRPGWAFLFFIGTLPFENINLAPETFGLAIRPYQFIGAILVLAIFTRLISGKLYFKLIKLEWFDYLILAMIFSSFLSLINAPDKFLSLKLLVVFVSFSVWYFLTRNYIQNLSDLKKVLPFFLSSGVVVVFYGLWQNIRFISGLSGFETMPGRPNATFTEADWLGIYLVLLISVCYSLIFYIQSKYANYTGKIFNFQPTLPAGRFLISSKIYNFLSYFILAVLYIILIITVSRSAWLGVFGATFIFLFVIWTNLRFKNWHWVETIKIKLGTLASLIIAVAIIYVFHLTDFQLFNRVQSTGSGLQKITVSCQRDIYLPESIGNISELENHDCRHINLEDIEKEKIAGKFVTEIFRTDPNINIRSRIYQTSWEEIKKHPILGIGWGSIGQILGKDERGTVLNSSNLYLEMWLGSGILGFLALLSLMGYILFWAVKNFYLAEGREMKVFSLFMITSWLGIAISNFFNAGIFLGFFWGWLAVASLKNYPESDMAAKS
jgi:hypothetical protein